MPPPVLIDPQSIDMSRHVADLEAIRRANPQRFEMEQLDAIVHLDPANHLVAGYKDVGGQEFWVRGHLPGYPLFPGVLMCEAAAQLCSFYIANQKLFPADFTGFGGLDNVRFRCPVRPGDRLLVIGKATKLNRRQVTFEVQGFVATTMVFQATVIGVPMQKKEET